MNYLVHLTLVSDEVTENIPGDWLENYDSEIEFLNNHYFASGGSAVRLNPESNFDFGESPFSSTEIDDSEDPAVLDEYGDGFKFVSSEEHESGDVDITYCFCPQIEVSVEADSEEEAENLCHEQVYQLFDIIDVAADEVIGTQSIEIHSVIEV